VCLKAFIVMRMNEMKSLARVIATASFKIQESIRRIDSLEIDKVPHFLAFIHNEETTAIWYNEWSIYYSVALLAVLEREVRKQMNELAELSYIY